MGVILGHLEFLCLSKRLFLLFPFLLISFNGHNQGTLHTAFYIFVLMVIFLNEGENLQQSALSFFSL